MSATIDTWVGRFGLLLGFSVIAAWLAIGGRPAEAPAPSANIRLGTLATGELAVSPLRTPVLESRRLRPGTGVDGAVSIRNETPKTLEVAVRTTAIQDELGGSGWIEIRDGAMRLVHARLDRARAWSSETVRLAPSEGRRLRARVWIPADAEDGWQAARGDLMLEFRGRPVDSR